MQRLRKGRYCQERLRVLFSGSVNRSRWWKQEFFPTQASFLSTPFSLSSFIPFLSSSFPTPLHLLLLPPVEASFCCCLDWLSLNVLRPCPPRIESFHHDYHKACAHGCAGKSTPDTLCPVWRRSHGILSRNEMLPAGRLCSSMETNQICSLGP